MFKIKAALFFGFKNFAPWSRGVPHPIVYINRNSAKPEEMLFFPRYRISVDSTVVPLKFSTKARSVKLEQ